MVFYYEGQESTHELLPCLLTVYDVESIPGNTICDQYILIIIIKQSVALSVKMYDVSQTTYKQYLMLTDLSLAIWTSLNNI